MKAIVAAALLAAGIVAVMEQIPPEYRISVAILLCVLFLTATAAQTKSGRTK